MQPKGSRTPFWTILLFSCLSIPCLEAQQPRVAFVTSVTGTADLGSWPEAGSALGASAGDEICRTLATAATLPNANSFVAWLSTSTDDAYCRLHGFTGKKSANCGQPQLPVSAGPWVRADGLPFGESIDQLLAPESIVYYPLAADENGAFVYAPVFTTTTANGALNSSESTCSDWTASSSESSGAGNTARGSWGWTNFGGLRCDSSGHLFCFEPGPGPALTPPAEEGAVAFVTSLLGTADLGSWPDAGGKTGVAAADAICQARAAVGSLENPSTFKAWISDSTMNAKDRFLSNVARVRPDGVKVADSLTDMLDSVLDSSINVTELGDYVGNNAVWTATHPTGLLSGDSCSDWTSASASSSARTGSSYSSDSAWTLIFTSACSFASSRLYCIEDPFIFIDGFESGDTTAWSSSTP